MGPCPAFTSSASPASRVSFSSSLSPRFSLYDCVASPLSLSSLSGSTLVFVMIACATLPRTFPSGPPPPDVSHAPVFTALPSRIPYNNPGSASTSVSLSGGLPLPMDYKHDGLSTRGRGSASPTNGVYSYENTGGCPRPGKRVSAAAERRSPGGKGIDSS